LIADGFTSLEYVDIFIDFANSSGNVLASAYNYLTAGQRKPIVG